MITSTSNKSLSDYYYNLYPILIVGISLLWYAASKHLIEAIFISSVFIWGRIILNKNMPIKNSTTIKSLCVLLSAGYALINIIGTFKSQGMFSTVATYLPFFALPYAFFDYTNKIKHNIRKEFAVIDNIKNKKNKNIISYNQYPTVINFSIIFFYIYMLSVMCLLDKSGLFSIFTTIVLAIYFLIFLVLQIRSESKITFKHSKPILGWILVMTISIAAITSVWLNNEKSLNTMISNLAEKLYIKDLLNNSLYKDPNKSFTKIGASGSISEEDGNLNELIIRLSYNNESQKNTKYLRTGIFNDYIIETSAWFNLRQKKPETILPNSTSGFMIDEIDAEGNSATLIYNFNNISSGESIPSPIGSYGLLSLEAPAVEVDSNGLFIGKNIISLQSFIFMFNNKNEYIENKDVKDLAFPKKLIPFFDIIKNNAKITDDMDDALKVETYKQYMQNNYLYTLDLNELNTNRGRTIETFLSTDKRGHCEFFATSSVLFFRYLGIPSKYATGFVIDEFDDNEQMYWIRAKHAHAWTLSYYNNTWNDVDTTVSGMYDELNKKTSIQSFIDSLTRLQYIVANYDTDKIIDYILNIYTLIIIIVIIGIAFIIQKINDKKELKNYFSYDEDINKTLNELRKKGIYKNNDETILKFAIRVRKTHNISFIRAVKLYYQERYGKPKE